MRTLARAVFFRFCCCVLGCKSDAHSNSSNARIKSAQAFEIKHLENVMTDEANTQENAGTAGEAGEPANGASDQVSDSAQLTSAAATSAPESAASTALGKTGESSTSQAAGESASDVGKPSDSAALALASGSDGDSGNIAAGSNSADLTSQERATPSGSPTESETSSLSDAEFIAEVPPLGEAIGSPPSGASTPADNRE